MDIDSLGQEFYDFIETHKYDDPRALLLKYHGRDLSFPVAFAITQIECRRKCAVKLSSFIGNKKFLFPDGISSEQASDQLVAAYHAALAGSGKSILDMTAGLGIDAFSIAMASNRVTAVEMDTAKALILKHNAESLGIDNFEVVCGDSLEFLSNVSSHYDIIFIDPARRRSDDSRAYSFEDCTPDVAANQELLGRHAARILVKASPLLDISAVRKELTGISMIHIVCVRGECKEILADIDHSEFRGVRFVDLGAEGIISDLFLSEDEMYSGTVRIADLEEIKAGGYLYEPNAALMKSTAFGAVCEKFAGLKKIGRNSNLYICDAFYPEFPGRVLKILSVPDRNDLKRLKGMRYNVVVRNYPLSAEALRRKLSLREGMDLFIYGCRVSNSDTPLIIEASRCWS